MAETINHDQWLDDFDNSEWVHEFYDFLGPEFWFWLDQAHKDRIIEDLLNGKL